MTFASKKDYLKHIECINNVTAYIDYFSNENENFGSWQTNSSSFPHINYSQKVHDFLDALEVNGLITIFDWRTWEYGEKIFENPSLIETLEFIDIQFLLTLIVRKERFCEGVLMNAIDNGMILKILIQLKKLYDVNENGLSMIKIFDENEEAILIEKEEKFKKQNEKAKKLLEDGVTIEPFYELSKELDLLKKINNDELIELNEFYITGLEYYDAKELDFSDIDYLSLHLEPNNEYDENAIEIYYQDEKVGYVPKNENSLITKMMQQNVNIIAKIINYDKKAPLQKRIKIRLYQDDMIEVITRESLEQEHIKVFGVEPYEIGMFWNSPESITQGIIDAIESDKPYNEYLMLSVEDRKAFDDGDLVF